GAEGTLDRVHDRSARGDAEGRRRRQPGLAVVVALEVEEGVAGAGMRRQHVLQDGERIAPDAGERDPDVHLADRLGVGAGEREDLVGDHLAALVGDLECARDHHRRAALELRLVPAVGVGPGDHLDHALLVLEHEGRVAVALLAVLETQRVDDAAQPPPARRPICADARSSARLAAQRMTSSSPARRRARLRSMESKAPHLTRLSITRRLTSWPRTRRQKSARLVSGPSSRAARTASIAFEPTPFTAPRPKRIVSPAAVKSSRLAFTSGGRMAMPRSRHSAMFLYVLSMSLASSERSPAMNSVG